jgi:hypothetical protein
VTQHGSPDGSDPAEPTAKPWPHTERSEAAQQAAVEQLTTILLQYGGMRVAVWPDSDPTINLVIEQGKLFVLPAVKKPGQRNRCHQNVARMYRDRQHGIKAIGTGYALTDDCIWREHSWGISAKRILETTTMRLLYFGVEMKGEAADWFCDAVLPLTAADAGAGSTESK